MNIRGTAEALQIGGTQAFFGKELLFSSNLTFETLLVNPGLSDKLKQKVIQKLPADKKTASKECMCCIQSNGLESQQNIHLTPHCRPT